MSYIISVAKRPIYERKPLAFGSFLLCRALWRSRDSPNGTLSSELKDAYKAAEPRNGWGPLGKGKGTRTAKSIPLSGEVS